jgi:hypothetical protein
MHITDIRLQQATQRAALLLKVGSAWRLIFNLENEDAVHLFQETMINRGYLLRCAEK